MKAENKPVLADAIWALVPEDVQGLLEDDHVDVIDGGSLLHQIPWQKGSTYNKICQKYTDYVMQHYGQASVVFDRYDSGPSTKDKAHLQRTRGQMTEVHFNGSM